MDVKKVLNPPSFFEQSSDFKKLAPPCLFNKSAVQETCSLICPEMLNSKNYTSDQNNKKYFDGGNHNKNMKNTSLKYGVSQSILKSPLETRNVQADSVTAFPNSVPIEKLLSEMFLLKGKLEKADEENERLRLELEEERERIRERDGERERGRDRDEEKKRFEECSNEKDKLKGENRFMKENLLRLKVKLSSCEASLQVLQERLIEEEKEKNKREKEKEEEKSKRDEEEEEREKKKKEKEEEREENKREKEDGKLRRLEEALEGGEVKQKEERKGCKERTTSDFSDAAMETIRTQLFASQREVRRLEREVARLNSESGENREEGGKEEANQLKSELLALQELHRMQTQAIQQHGKEGASAALYNKWRNKVYTEMLQHKNTQLILKQANAAMKQLRHENDRLLKKTSKDSNNSPTTNNLIIAKRNVLEA